MGYSAGDYRLGPDSEAVNYGSNALWNANSNNITVDILGEPRIADSIIDAGAYESTSVVAFNCEIAETGQQFTRIQLALDALGQMETTYGTGAGNTIQVYAGTHSGTGNVGLVWPNQTNIILQGVSSVDTVLDAEFGDRHIIVASAVSFKY